MKKQSPIYHKRARLKRVTEWIHHHHKTAYLIAALLVLVVSASAGALIFYRKPVKEAAAPPHIAKKAPAPAPPPVYYSPLTGEKVDSQAATTQAATAIMIENSPDARPQSGLKAAGVVFEAIAEGGITRFLALYQQEKPQLIGPVRSVRPYYISWLTPFQPGVAHVGGSLQALQTIRNGSYRDLDQFFNAGTYWRATDRYAPHNVYTSFARLDALEQSKGYTQSTVAGFELRKDAAPSKAPNATHISVHISGPWYDSTYAYDPPSNTYLRSEGGQPHMDREAGQIAPTVVIALHVNEQTVMQDGYREQIGTVGSSEVNIFQDGVATHGTWHKASDAAQLSFTDDAGKPIALDRGQAWLVGLPNGQGSVSWQ